MLQYSEDKMSNTVIDNEPAGVEKEGWLHWLKRNFFALIIFLLVMAIVVGLFIFSHRYPEKIAAFENWGYLGAFLLSIITTATVILPFPGIVLLFAMGAAFNPIFIGLAAGVGGTIGEMTAYLLGYSGRGVMKNIRFYKQSVLWLKKWGSLTVFVFAATPLPFDVLGIGAGALRFPVWKFLIACWAGKTIIYVAMAFAGDWGWEAFLTGRLLSSPVAISVLSALGALALLVLALFLERWAWKRGR